MSGLGRPHTGTGRRRTFDRRNGDFVQNPYASYAEWHGDGPAFWWEEAQHWCLIGHGAVNAALRERRLGRQITHIVSRANLGWPPRPDHLADFDRVEAASLLELEPPEHTRLRKLVNRAFTSRNIESLQPFIEQLCDRLIDGFIDAGTTELLSSYATPVPLDLICHLLGVDGAHGHKLLDWSHAMVRMYVADPPMSDQHEANRAAGEFADFVRAELVRKRREPGDDLLSALIAAMDEGDKLCEAELVSTVILLLNAGHEATVHQIGNAVHSIIGSGIDQQTLFATPEQGRRTVEECLRHNAPLHMFTRYALEDFRFEAGGASIALKQGDVVGLLLGAANHDPLVFADPIRFDPFRTDPAGAVSFGAGIHFCIGAPLARLELQVALKRLFDRLGPIRFKQPPVYADTWHFHGLEACVLEWDPSAPRRR